MIDKTKLRLLAIAASPGPWHACREGKCHCSQIWSKPADHPVATVTRGKWGDEYPSLEVDRPSIAPKFKPVMKMIEYGEVLDETANANAALIAACSPDTILSLLEKLDQWQSRVQNIVEVYESRSELFTNDSDCAATLADNARILLMDLK